MANNLRLIYNNVADTSILTTGTTISATNYPASNLNKDAKSMVWRSNNTTTDTITMTWTTDQVVNAIILPFTNLSVTCTMAITLYSDTAGATNIGTYSAAACVPAALDTYNSQATGNYVYSYGGGTTARRYITKVTNCRKIVITLVDSSNSAGYLEVSRCIVGSYWSPKYNTSFGLEVGVVDSSTVSRTQSGNIITDAGTINKTLNLPLGFMNTADRDALFAIMRTNGMRKSLYVSTFPEDTDGNKEQIYQIYGRLSSLATIVHPMFTQYTSSLQIEEV